jgi:putative peptide zinc metalloprotease protein
VESMHSPSWYRVAPLRLRLSSQARFHRHQYRGETWYVVRNPIAGRFHRLAPAAHALLERMDGERTTQQVWDAVVEERGDEAPTQEEALGVLGLLHAAGLLRGDLPPDTAALFQRVQEEDRRERLSKLSPIAFRVPLFDPDAFLTRWQHLARPIFSRAGALLWCGLVLLAGLSALKHAPELAAASTSLLEPASVLALWFAYPLVKALHELGHGFAVKRWGGEVHEIGILFLVFMPVPYVDASAASAFPEKRRRMAVSAAGIGVELFLAAICFFVWLAVEPGFIRHLAYAVMLIGGVSTLLFNGNPLLRFDGYYVLADAIELPNLASRSNRFLGTLARRFLLGLSPTQAPLPHTSAGEAPWLVGYALASFAYRTAVLLGIALYLASHFFVLGVALALITVATRILLPLLRHASYVLTDPAVGERRGRALAGSAGLLAALALLVFALPVPLHTRSEGVTWLPERSHVRAGADGFVIEVLAEPHAAVQAGESLIRTRDPSIEARVRVLEAERRELHLEVLALAQADRAGAEIARERLAEADASLARAREHASEVQIQSPADGIFVIAGGRDLVGRYLRQGEVVAYVVDLASVTARVVVTQQDVGLLRERTEAASVRLAHDLGQVLPSHITRQVPAASDRLPTRALGTSGGGPFAVDPTDPDGLRTLEPIFQFDLSLPAGAVQAAGERVHVRFDHGAEPVGQRAYRALRRLFLRQLGV